jgi:hypothetical protein
MKILNVNRYPYSQAVQFLVEIPDSVNNAEFVNKLADHIQDSGLSVIGNGLDWFRLPSGENVLDVLGACEGSASVSDVENSIISFKVS